MDAGRKQMKLVRKQFRQKTTNRNGNSLLLLRASPDRRILISIIRITRTIEFRSEIHGIPVRDRNILIFFYFLCEPIP